jgi:alkylation response protein AidB-like acyl-CoA dehydrogenase
MDVTLNDEQVFLRESVSGVVARDASFTKVRAWAEAGHFEDVDELAVRQGWTGIGLDEKDGGQGGGVQELAVLAEQLGRGAVPWDRTFAACIAGPALAACGPEGQALAAASAAGEHSCVLCLDASKPLSPVNGSITDDRITARCPFVLGAADAEELIVPVARGDEITLLAVINSSSNVTITPRRLVDRTRSLADVDITDAPYRVLSGAAESLLSQVFDTAVVLTCADTLGAVSRMLEMTTEYLIERRQFGVPVGSFQAVKHSAAEMLVDVEAARSSVSFAAWAVAAGTADASLHAAVAKSFCAAAGVRVADRALFLHGAVGYTWEHDLQFPFKRAKSNSVLFGSSDAYRDLIAAELELLPFSA